MASILGSSPRTTIIGYIEAILIAVIPVIVQDGFDIKKQWPFLVLAAARAISGRIQKDSDGITKQEDVIVAKAATDGKIPPPERQSDGKDQK